MFFHILQENDITDAISSMIEDGIQILQAILADDWQDAIFRGIC